MTIKFIPQIYNMFLLICAVLTLVATTTSSPAAEVNITTAVNLATNGLLMDHSRGPVSGHTSCA